jgi:hypothetical protein
MLLPDGGQIPQSHSAVVGRALAEMRAAAEHRHFMAALDHPPADLLDAGLESAVAGRHAARADESDLHFEVRLAVAV